jgi:hypothetical protein
VVASCNQQELVAVDVATGATKWSLPGGYSIGPVADGKAIVQPYAQDANGNPQPPGPWKMLDIATGKDIAGQQWPTTVDFSSGCCGDAETHHTQALGGVVVAVNGVDVNVWFPKELSTSTIQVAVL